MKQNTLKENAMLTDRSAYLYIEHAIVEQESSSISIIQGNRHTPVPIASLCCLLLGPGVSVTHRAIGAIAESGCLVVWVGENYRAFYANGIDENRSSKNFLRQMECATDPVKHLQVVRWMYKQRFPNVNMRGMDLEQMRGAEGKRMKELYQKYADMYQVQWKGRQYDDEWDSQEPIQQAITVGNKLLYNVCHAAILALGFSPTIGFIHTGTMRSFVYDISDLYKSEIVIPTAFRSVSQTENTALFRLRVKNKIEEYDLLSKIGKDLYTMFDICKSNDKQEDQGYLWAGNQTVLGGFNYDNH